MTPDAPHAPGFKVTKDDGKTVFHDVPIFAECERGELVFGAEWVSAAVAEAKSRELDGYLPPLHVRHHEPDTAMTDAVRPAGVFRITGCQPLTFKGQRVLAVFADLIVTDADLAEEIERMRYPYRSVEIFDPEGPPKINSLALLDHEAPYLELPMLLAREIDDRRTPARLAQLREDGRDVNVAHATDFTLHYRRDPKSRVVASARDGQKASLLFRFSDTDTMTDTTHPDPADQADKPAATFADEKGEEAEDMQDEAGGMDVASVCEAIKSGEISVADMALIEDAIIAQRGAVAEDEGEEAAPAPVPGAEIMRGDSKASAIFARQQARIDALEANMAARDAADQRAKDVSEAMTRLDGRPLGADLEQRLTNFHAKHGAEAFGEYVGELARTAAPMPAGSDAHVNFNGQPQVPASAMLFSNLGSEALEHAARFAREYGQLRGIRASEESYVKTNMAHLGFKLENTPTA